MSLISSDRRPLFSIADRYESYLKAAIPDLISEHDDMYARGEPGAMEHYMHVGRSAVEVIVNAMVAAGKPNVGTVLDLPCGGGRVTRHLSALFPDAEVYASDLNPHKEDFVVRSLGAKSTPPNPDFAREPDRRFDLIFVGSLVTHFDAEKFKRSVNWFIRALAPDGLLVLTTHGRRHEYMQQNVRQYISAAEWDVAARGFETTGFGYVPYSGQDYGLSECSPSWLLQTVEREPTIRIVSFQEAIWDYHQDVLVIQIERCLVKGRDETLTPRPLSRCGAIVAGLCPPNIHPLPPSPLHSTLAPGRSRTEGSNCHGSAWRRQRLRHRNRRSGCSDAICRRQTGVAGL